MSSIAMPQPIPTAVLATWIRLWELGDDPGRAGYVTDRAYMVRDPSISLERMQEAALRVALNTPGVCIKFAESPDGDVWFERGTGIHVEEYNYRHIPESEVARTYSSHATWRRNEGFDLQTGPLFGIDLMRFGTRTLLHVWRFHMYLSGRAESRVIQLVLDAACGRQVPDWDCSVRRWNVCRDRSEQRLMPTVRSQKHVERVIRIVDGSPGLTRLGCFTPGETLSTSGRSHYEIEAPSQVLEALAWTLRVTPYVLHLAAYSLVVSTVLQQNEVVLSTSFSSVDGVITAEDVGNWGFDGYICLNVADAGTFGELAQLIRRELREAEAAVVTHEEFMRQLGCWTSDLKLAHSFAESAPIGADSVHEKLAEAPPGLRVPGAITLRAPKQGLSEARRDTWKWHGAPNLEVTSDRRIGVMHANSAIYSMSTVDALARAAADVLDLIASDPSVGCARLQSTIERLISA